MNYRSVDDLNQCVLKNLHKVPDDVELIVGIPRSGLLAANLLALHINLPLTDLQGFIQGRVLNTGYRSKRASHQKPRPYRKALVIDDSIHSGRAMLEARELVENAKLPIPSLFGCVYIKPGAESMVDLFFERCPIPRIFEWNIFHSPRLEESCVDIDGVLCRDPTEEENDDGEKYCRFLSSVPPRIIPSYPLGWLVTCRLEKYRSLTEEWLRQNGIRYNRLIMMNLPDKSSRIHSQGHSQFKADVYLQTDAKLFIESSVGQATKIAKVSGRSVFCIENRTMYASGTTMATSDGVAAARSTFGTRIRRLARKIAAQYRAKSAKNNA